MIRPHYAQDTTRARFGHEAIVAVILVFLTGCGAINDPVAFAKTAQPNSSADLQATAQTRNYSAKSASTSPRRAIGVAFLLFGGRDHTVYLGCLNCSKYDSDSIWNRFGNYGSRFSDTSIWNRFGTYGSKFNDESPWNTFGRNPPVVVDHDGNFYGYFTANQFFQKRTTIPSLLQLLDNYESVMENLDNVIDSMQ
jgi:hypothetical protein